MSKDFPDGVLWYTEGIITLRCYFPQSKVQCQYCDFCYKENGFDRYRCRLTNEMIFAPDVGVGSRCPIEIMG